MNDFNVLVTGNSNNFKSIIKEILQSNIDGKCFNIDTGYTIPEILQKEINNESNIKDLKSCEGIPTGKIFVFDSLEPISEKTKGPLKWT